MSKAASFSLFRALVVGGFCAALCMEFVAPARSDDTVKVGFAVAQSGWMEAYDKGATNSALMAIDEINAKGGLLGKQIVPIVKDNRTDLAQAAQVAQSLLADNVVLLVTSCDYDVGAPAALAAENAGKISFFLCAGDIKAGVQGIGPNSFSGGNVGTLEGATMAEWSYKKRGARTGYILLDTSIQYNRSVCAGFRWLFPQLSGAKIVGEDTYKSGDTSIASQVTRIKALNPQPDVIMLCGVEPGAASAARQLRAAGINSAIVNGIATDGDYWLASAPDLKDYFGLVKGSVHGDDPRAAVNEYVKRYAAKYGAPPATHNNFDGYTTIELWAKAVRKAGTFETGPVVAALNSFKNEPTLFGPRTFTPEAHNQTRIPFLIEEVRDGKWKVIDQFELSNDIPMNVMLAN